jgi:hypothetical protein
MTTQNKTVVISEVHVRMRRTLTRGTRNTSILFLRFPLGELGLSMRSRVLECGEVGPSAEHDATAQQQRGPKVPPYVPLFFAYRGTIGASLSSK